MDADRFQQMVARLERESARSHGLYQFKVALLALLGFGVLFVVMGLAGLGVLLLGGVVVLAVIHGGAAALLLAKLGKLLVLLALPLWYLVKSSFQALFVRLPAPEGVEITRAQAPALFAAMDDMRRRMRGPRFHHVLLVDEVNAAVVQRPLLGLIGFPRNYLVLGLPLLESLDPHEALSVVAHEYGHLAGSHGRFAAFIYRLRLTWATISAYADRWQGWVGGGLRRLVSWYAPYFNAYTFVLARAQEYQADRASADLVGAPVAAHALKRVNLAGPHYQRFIGQTFDRIGEQALPPGDLSLRWAEAAAVPAPEGEVRRWLNEALDRAPQALDTHPTLRARLAALPGQGAVMAELPPARSGASAAQAWLGALLSEVRERFQRDWAQRVAEPWTQRHREILAQRERLAVLRAQASLDAQEEYERLRLQVLLEPEVDSLAPLAAYNAAHPGHAPALFLEAGLRLDRGDESGLALLDRAMELDADAIKPGCERAHGFLTTRQDAARQDADRARAYEERWLQRHRFELERADQVNQLDPKHRLEPAALDAQTADRLQAVLRSIDRKGIRRVYLARRVIPIDPTVQTYVLGVVPTWWARQRGRQPAIVNRLVAQTWPMHLFVCSLDSNRAIAKALKKLPGAEVPMPAG